jgi:hypothetical protein
MATTDGVTYTDLTTAGQVFLLAVNTRMVQEIL